MNSFVIMNTFAHAISQALRQYMQVKKGRDDTEIMTMSSLHLNVINPVRIYVSKSTQSLVDLSSAILRIFNKLIQYSRISKTISGQLLIKEVRKYSMNMVMVNQSPIFINTATTTNGRSPFVLSGPAENKIANLFQQQSSSSSSCLMSSNCLKQLGVKSVFPWEIVNDE